MTKMGCDVVERERTRAATVLLSASAHMSPIPRFPVLLVALTGNIASGKSTVAARFASLGAHIIDADLLAREVVEPGTPALAEIVERWGRDILAPGGRLDRAALGSIVFADRSEREALNAIVHPRVEALRRQRVADARARGDRVIICDIPLLFEKGLDGAFDAVILVDASRSTRRARLMELRALSADAADQMIDAQMSAEQKRDGADYIIENNGTPAALGIRVDDVWQSLIRRECAHR